MTSLLRAVGRGIAHVWKTINDSIHDMFSIAESLLPEDLAQYIVKHPVNTTLLITIGTYFLGPALIKVLVWYSLGFTANSIAER